MQQCKLCDLPLQQGDGKAAHLICESRRRRGVVVSLAEFTDACAAACVDADVNKWGTLLLTVDDDPGVVCLGVPLEEKDPGDLVPFFEGRRFAAMASLTRWSPDDVVPFADAWALTTVQPERKARWSIYRAEEPAGWWNIEPEYAPWFMLSTAGALRGFMKGETSPVRQVGDERLFNNVFQEPPPVHPDGRV